MKEKIFFKSATQNYERVPWWIRNCGDFLKIKCWWNDDGIGLKKEKTVQNVDGRAPCPEEGVPGSWQDQGSSNREPPRGTAFGLYKPSPAHIHANTRQRWLGHLPPGSTVDVGWSQREKAGSHAHQRLEHPCHKTNLGHPLFPAAQPSPSPLTHIPLLPQGSSTNRY